MTRGLAFVSILLIASAAAADPPIQQRVKPDEFDFSAAGSALKALPPGSFYTEPPGDPHFAETRDSDVVLQITGFGPTGTTY